MAQLKLTPPSNVLSLKVPRALTSETNGKAEPKPEAKAYRSGDIEPPVPVTPERIELIKAFASHVLRAADNSPASQIAQRFAPRGKAAAPPPPDPRTASPAPQAPSSALASGIHRLTVVLVAAALLPNLTLAAFWLGLIHPPWSQPTSLPPAASHAPSVESAIASPVLSAPDTLDATEGEDIALPIALDGTDGVPPGSVIVVRGLPQGSSLSSGRPQGATDWTLKPDEIGDLHLKLPADARGESRLTIELLAPNNGILADAATTLMVAAEQTASIAAAAIETAPAEAEVSEMPDQEPAETEESAANADPAASVSDLPPLPTRRPAPPGAADAGQANWIRPSAYVNLRESPSSSAAVVSVVAKGTKLRVLGRKRGWVQVTNQATSQSGWIYSGNVDATH